MREDEITKAGKTIGRQEKRTTVRQDESTELIELKYRRTKER